MVDEAGKRRFRVAFVPDGAAVDVAPGTTILDACRAVGIPIDAVCGGEGKCGRCKVRPKGKFEADASPLLTADDLRSGVVLACASHAKGDLTVEVLPRSRVGKHQILTRTVVEVSRSLSPWVRKRSIKLPPASISDNVADLERLWRGLKRKNICMPLDTLRSLPGTIRQGDWKVTASVSELDFAHEITRVEPGDKTGRLLGIALDIGTTTVVVELVDLTDGTVLGSASDYNKQVSRGEDVIARMMYAEEKGMDELTSLVRGTINERISRLLEDETKRSGIATEPEDIVAVSVAGNTIMSQLFVGLETRNIRLEPYVPVAHHIPCLHGGEVGLRTNPAAKVLLFPSRAGYVGGDVVADVLASGMHRSGKLTLLIDVGTNGEIVLGGKDWMVACSCSAGPAFEGGEVSCGMRAMDGAIDRIRVNDNLSTSYHVLGEKTPAGICGSGLIDLLAEMYAKGIIDRKARIQDVGDRRVRGTDSGLEYVIEWKNKLGKGASSDLAVTDADLQNLLRTKAAIYGACSVLLKKTETFREQVDGVVIAGGFGFHLDIGRAISIGMFPDLPQKKYRFIGNGALGGARLALLSGRRRKEALDIFDMMTYFELSVDNAFYNEFSAALFIPHTDLSRFPSSSGGAHKEASS
ncbi:MAG: ASKHA domain-containing protein [Thermoplasmatota archaeon]|nr:DUF4445 domain-containing protein [Candidatus Thermoplasmatota archaeon]MBU1914479.1 DUF4445 domain-containing protein [Candidatus Thermoplasmatota archaeon]